MTCVNCSLSVSKYLEKKGNQEVKVNFITGEVSFISPDALPEAELEKGVEQLGYTVSSEGAPSGIKKKKLFTGHGQRFLFCAVFTLPLMLHMLHPYIHVPWLMNPWIQLALTLPVYIVGMDFFGRSAVKSIVNRRANMNVLITIGATAAFVYSLVGSLLKMGPDYLFYETAAAIITLVFLGNYLEEKTIRSTQKALNKLAKVQKVTANMIAFDEHHQEIIMPVDNKDLRSGDLVLIRSGELVPADCKILWGDAGVNEAIITGESLPVTRGPKDKLIGGSMLESGTVKAQVTADPKHSVLSEIINLVKQAQGEKPPVQQLADKISAVFVPVVLGLALITFIGNYLWLSDDRFLHSLMRTIAVLVIACPCAMGLATPAAIAVGLGRAARSGILFRHAKSLESFKDIRQVVFDKTGTLTTGDFEVSAYKILDDKIRDEEFKSIVYALERYSTHPIARSLARQWKTTDIRWKKTTEIRGVGMKATDMEGSEYLAGSYHFAAEHTREDNHNVYVLKDNRLIGWIDVKDQVRPEAQQVVNYLKKKNITTILLSGDKEEKCREMAAALGIDQVMAEHSPAQKLEAIVQLTRSAPTIMVGDGINDAPALAKATIGISLSAASQLAMQTADVVLMDNGLKNLPTAIGLGKHSYLTIKQNLFWAFFYNIIAIPIAAFGWLTPTFAALAMGLSDVVLAANSVRLFVKKVE